MTEGPATTSAGQRARNFSWASILIADDNEPNRQLLARAIARFGSQVRHATDGEAALEAMATWRTDLLLLDLAMPGLNGFDVLERMASDRALANVAVIVVSASDDMQSIVRAIQLGADDYIPKPCPLEVLRARIGGSLERLELRRTAGTSSHGRETTQPAAGHDSPAAATVEAVRSTERLRELVLTMVRLSNLVAAELPAESQLRKYLAEIDRAGREAEAIAQELLRPDRSRS